MDTRGCFAWEFHLLLMSQLLHGPIGVTERILHFRYCGGGNYLACEVYNHTLLGEVFLHHAMQVSFWRVMALCMFESGRTPTSATQEAVPLQVL